MASIRATCKEAAISPAALVRRFELMAVWKLGTAIVSRIADKASESDASGPAARIALRPFQPDAAYARRLRDATDDQRYAVYLDERPGQLAAFFMDAAEVFFSKGQTALGVRVLSNLAEMELENRHILRILAYRLSQAGLHALAVPLLEPTQGAIVFIGHNPAR